MLELTDFGLITGIFLVIISFLEIARYLDMKGQKEVFKAMQIEMRTEFKNSLQELKNAGTGLKTSLSRLLTSVDIPGISTTDIFLKELATSPFMEQLLARGADKLGITGPSIPKVAEESLAEQGEELLKKVLTKEEFAFLEQVQQKVISATKDLKV